MSINPLETAGATLMEHCAKCGRELPARSAGTVCADCQLLAHQPEGFPGREIVVQPVGATRMLPPVTILLVGINTLVFVAMTLTGASPVRPAIERLLLWGANWGPLSLGPEPWRTFTSNYVHGGFIHLAFNMWCLWNLGGLAESI